MFLSEEILGRIYFNNYGIAKFAKISTCQIDNLKAYRICSRLYGVTVKPLNA